MNARVIVAVLALLGPAWASSGAVARCLDEVDIGCADRVLAKVDLATSADASLVYQAARARFFAGRFDEAASLMRRAIELGHEDRYEELQLFERTREATQDFVEERRGDRYIVRYRPGLDRVLVDEAFQTLELAERHLAPVIGGPPPAPIVAELYPTGRIFTEATPLSEKDVKTTGVVAISKYARLLVTSPRALGRGYPWQDTLAHEFIHQVVSHHSGERAPVWLQEGIAKFLDNRWRDGKDNFKLDPRSETLIAQALRNDQLVPFEMMHPSLAKLPTAELAALAYAQLATLLQFVFSRAGEGVLPGVLAEVKRGVDPRVALSKAAGFASFEDLERGWRDFIRQQGLRDLQVEELPSAVDAGGDSMATDPVMEQRKDLARLVRLGELLLDRGHAEAALIQLAKADGDEGSRSPLLQTRIAQAHLALGERDTARDLLTGALERYPDFLDAWKTLGKLEAAAGRPDAARRAWARAVELDPFDLTLHESLAPLYDRAGESKRAARHREQAAILRQGG